MSKKKHRVEPKDKPRDKQGGKHEAETGRRAGTLPLPLAGIAAMVTHQLQSPATRAALANGLRAAADALSKASAPPARPQPPVPPQPAVAEVPPVAPAPPQGTTRSADTNAIADVIGDAADMLLGRLFGPRKQ